MSFFKGFKKATRKKQPEHDLVGVPFHQWDELDKVEYIMHLEGKHKKIFPDKLLPKSLRLGADKSAVGTAKSQKEIDELFKRHAK